MAQSRCVSCLVSFLSRVHICVLFSLEKHNFTLRKRKQLLLMGIFMSMVWRAFWAATGYDGTTLWWVKCKRLRNAQIKFPWKHSRASKTTGEKHSGHVYLRLYNFLSLSCTLLILFSSPKHFLGWPHLLWLACCQAKIVINPGSFWVA